MQYSKPSLDIAAQIQLLESRGLTIDDRPLAEHFLSFVSYYRLAGYWWPLQADKKKHVFKSDSKFSTVIELYNFDRELRLLVFDMIERIEIGLRTQLIYHLSNAYSPWWFENKNLFYNQKYWRQHLISLKKEVNRSREVFIQEHNKQYKTDSRCPPAWKSLEVISLGLLSKFYQNLKKEVPEKRKIAKNFHVGSGQYLSSWLRSISVVRNICAHHSRLWNRHLPTPPKLLRKASKPFVETTLLDAHSFYTVLCSMQYLLLTISPKNSFRKKLIELLKKYPTVDERAMGFLDGWRNESFWQQKNHH